MTEITPEFVNWYITFSEYYLKMATEELEILPEDELALLHQRYLNQKETNPK